MAKVLVAYGSKMGGTAAVAERIGEVIAGGGHQVDVSDVGNADLDAGYDALVVGSAVYNRQWRGRAVALVKQISKRSPAPPLWLFQSGPLGDDVGTPQVFPAWLKRIDEGLDLRDKVTFGGVIDENAKGFLAKSMLRNGRGGDFRDWDAIAAWAEGISSTV